MKKQITSVFYSSDLLPYKDSARTIHYPLTAGTFVGSHNTKQIRFYVRDIGGTDNITWVVLSKLPNGKIGYEVCSNVQPDSEVGEYYLQFDLSAYYTSAKGDLYLSLRGYEGEVEFEDDNNDGVYNIVGDPLIEVTGTIKLAINYSPMVNTGTQVLPTDIDKLILALNNYIPKGMGIVVIPNLSYNVGSYNDGQIFFVEEQKTFYKKVSGALVKEEIALPFAYLTTQTAEELYQLYGNRVFTLQYYSSLLICKISYNLDRLYEFAVYQYDMQEGNNITCYRVGTNTGSDSFVSLLSSATQIKTFATKEYVDSQLQEFLQKEYDKVDISEYPTLDDFLSSTGEEGYIYLYPVDISDESKGYYQYIWENNAWVSLGSTNIDLSGYLEKTTSANKVYATDNSGNQTTISVDSFYEGNIARRDIDNSITVPLTPTQNGHASSKKYVDDEINNLSSEVNEELEKKANVDGNYPTMTVGSADNLTPYGENSGAEDSTPFVFQSTGGSSDVGSKAYLRELRGNSVAFNQVLTVNIPNWVEKAGLTLTIDTTNNTFTLNGTTTSTLANSGWGVGTGIQGHTYLYKLKLVSGSVDYSNRTTQNTRHGYVLQPRIGGYGYLVDMPTSAKQEISQIRTQTESSAQLISASFDTGVVFNNAVFQWQIFDLTLLGKIYADVVSFNRDYPKPYYPYNAGTLLSCKVNGYKTVGYNAWDEEWEQGAINTEGVPFSAQRLRSKNFTRVIGGQNYSFYCSVLVNFNVFYYDIDKNFIGSTTKTNSATKREAIIEIPQNVSYIKFYLSSEYGNGTFYNNDIAIHLTWDESRTGYEPYKSETYQLPNVELRSAGSVYDELKPDGTLIRRIKELVFDSSTTYVEVQEAGGANERVLIRFDAETITKELKNNVLYNTLTNKYLNATANQTYSHTYDKIIAIARVQISSSRYCPAFWIYDSALIGKTVAQVKEALAGLIIYTGDLEETTEQTEYTFAETTPIDDYGTQEFLYDSDIAIPVPQGNEFFYPVDYKAFVDSLGGRDDIEYAADQVVSQTQLTQALSTFLSSIQGYDATKTQTLKNVSGVFQWVDD